MIRLFQTGLFVCMLILVCCEPVSDVAADRESGDPLEELIRSGDVTGRLSPFRLIENSDYKPIHEIESIEDHELVLVTKLGSDVRVYPYRSMNVEIINETVGGQYIAITFCPLTRSGIGWNRILGKDTLRLTGSGYLYRENLMPLDLNSGTIWSQMQLTGISGKHQQQVVETFPLVETTWKSVRDHFPGAGVFMNDTQTKAAYKPDPSHQELGILGNLTVELFTLEMFPEEVTLLTIPGNRNGTVVVAGSAFYHFMVAFRTAYLMQPVSGSFPVIMKDETGSYWNIFGEAVAGDRAGEKLDAPPSYSAADWAWRFLFPRVTYFGML